MAIKIRKKVDSPETTEQQSLSPEIVDEEQDLSNAIRIPDKAMDDRFVRTSGTLFSWVLENGRKIALVAAIIVICVIAIVIFSRSKESDIAEKSTVLGDALITLRAPTQEQANADLALQQARLQQQGIAADTQEVLAFSYTVPNDQVRREVIYDHLQKSVPVFKGQAIQIPVELMSAGFAMQLGKIEEAQRDYNSAATTTDEDIRLFAQLGQANILAGQGNYEEAIKVYEEIQSSSGSFYASFATLNIARLYEESKNNEKAIQAYTKVVKEYNQPSDVHAATERLKLLTPKWEEIIAPQAILPANAPQS